MSIILNKGTKITYDIIKPVFAKGAGESKFIAALGGRLGAARVMSFLDRRDVLAMTMVSRMVRTDCMYSPECQEFWAALYTSYLTVGGKVRSFRKLSPYPNCNVTRLLVRLDGLGGSYGLRVAMLAKATHPTVGRMSAQLDDINKQLQKAEAAAAVDIDAEVRRMYDRVGKRMDAEACGLNAQLQALTTSGADPMGAARLRKRLAGLEASYHNKFHLDSEKLTAKLEAQREEAATLVLELEGARDALGYPVLQASALHNMRMHEAGNVAGRILEALPKAARPAPTPEALAKRATAKRERQEEMANQQRKKIRAALGCGEESEDEESETFADINIGHSAGTIDTAEGTVEVVAASAMEMA